MTWVADASVAVAYLLGEASDVERAGMRGDVHVPALLDVEVTQTLRGLVRAAKLDLRRAQLGRDELGQLAARRHPDAVLLPRAWELRDICTIYDGLYVSLTEALDATLITRDRRLARGAGGLVEIAGP